MSKKANNYFTHREIQLLKSEMFEKTNYVNALMILNIHIFLSEEKKLDNKQEKAVISKQNLKLCESHFKISLSESKDIQIVILK